jgi:hypothetical protein
VRRGREATLDARGHLRHQDAVAKPLPAFFRIVNGDDHPAVGRRPGRMKLLTFWKAAPTGMHSGDGRLVLVLRPTWEVMNNGVGHFYPRCFCFAPEARVAPDQVRIVAYPAEPQCYKSGRRSNRLSRGRSRPRLLWRESSQDMRAKARTNVP